MTIRRSLTVALTLSLLALPSCMAETGESDSGSRPTAADFDDMTEDEFAELTADDVGEQSEAYFTYKFRFYCLMPVSPSSPAHRTMQVDPNQAQYPTNLYTKAKNSSNCAGYTVVDVKNLDRAVSGGTTIGASNCYDIPGKTLEVIFYKRSDPTEWWEEVDRVKYNSPTPDFYCEDSSIEAYGPDEVRMLIRVTDTQTGSVAANQRMTLLVDNQHH